MAADFDNLVHAVYEAPLFPGGWAHFTASLHTCLHAAGCAVISYPSGSSSPTVAEYSGDPDTARLYGQYYGAINPWLPAIQHLHVGQVATDEELLASSLFRQTEFYNDFGRRQHVVHTAGVNLIADVDQIAFLSMDRGEADGPFPTEQIQLLTRLTPHLRRAVRIQNELSQRIFETTRFLPTPDAQFLLDAEARIVDLNPAAQGLLQAGRVSELPNRQLDITGFCPFPLKQSLAAGEPCQVAVPASSRSAVRPIVSLIPLPTPQGNPFAIRRLFRLTIHLKPPTDPTLKSHALAWNLTAAELRLLTPLAEGQNLRECAESLRLSYNTVKSQVASIYAKSGSRSQAQLIRKISGPFHPLG